MEYPGFILDWPPWQYYLWKFGIPCSISAFANLSWGDFLLPNAIIAPAIFFGGIPISAWHYRDGHFHYGEIYCRTDKACLVSTQIPHAKYPKIPIRISKLHHRSCHFIMEGFYCPMPLSHQPFYYWGQFLLPNAIIAPAKIFWQNLLPHGIIAPAIIFWGIPISVQTRHTLSLPQNPHFKISPISTKFIFFFN